MKGTMKRWMGWVVCLFLAAVVMVPPSSAADEPAMVVGRIFHIEGDLLRYVPAEKDWVAVVKDAPFGTEDTLFSGSRGMAELIVPNGTWIRIGNSTQIQFIALDTDLAEMDVASGMARFYNKGSDTVIKVTSPFGYVLADPGTVFDFYVGDNSVEVVAVKGTVSFVHSATDARYDVAAGSPSILADQQQVSSGEGTVDPDWNRWNTVRENFWAAKARVRGPSVEYLPPSLRDEAYALDENGRWERVPYEGTSRWFWRPTSRCRLVAFHRGPLDRLVRGPDLDSGRTLRLRHPPLRQLGLRAELLVLGPACGERARRSPPPRRGLLLVSRKGFLDSHRNLCGMGASGAARDVLQLPPLGRPSYGGREQRQHHPDQHQRPELCLRKPCHRRQPEQFLRCEQLHEMSG